MPILNQANITGYNMRKQELHPLTAKINMKQKARAKQSRGDALRWLAATFPRAFDDTLSIHPLKLGIMEDILAHADKAAAAGISKSKLREAVILFTRRIDYLTCLKAREMRIDLEGNPTVIVSDEESASAALKIKKHIEKSAKIAKQNAEVATSPVASKSNTSSSFQLNPDSIPYATDIDYDPRYAAVAQPARTASVIVKHKTTKAYDPDAVARLKEKLGLSRTLELPR